jgi:hypothetical protein
VCAASYRQNARCRLDVGLDLCYGDGLPGAGHQPDTTMAPAWTEA